MARTDTAVPRELLATATERLRELCATSSPSGDAAGIRRLARKLEEHLTRHGFAVEIVDELDAHVQPQPVLVASRASGGGPPLLLLGHMDTVLPAVEPSIEARALFGTGALDMKGGLAALLGALDLIALRGDPLPADMLVVLVPDEESESLISGRAAHRWSRDARAVLVLEPGKATARGETLVAGRRGLTEWTLEVEGRAAHSGVAYWSGRSAVAAAGEWCARAQALSRRESGATVNAARLVAGGVDFVRGLAEHHRIFGSSRQLNVIADRAVAEGEVRFLSEREGEDVLGELERLAEEIASSHQTSMRFVRGMHIPPVDPGGPGAALIRHAVDLAARRGVHLEVEEDRGGISFPNFLADPARTPVIDGLGPVGDGMHVRGEHVDLDSFERRIVLLADLLPTL